MVAPAHAPVLLPALATGIGSLPHDDATAAAELVMRLLPRLPSAPQLPNRDPRERMIAQWLVALPEVEVGSDGELAISGRSDEPPVAAFHNTSHGGLLAFLDVAARGAVDPPRLKVQCAGPLTLGMALAAAGMPVERAFRRAAEAVHAWTDALEVLVASRLPGSSLLVFLDEPALVAWRRGHEPLARDTAIDVLSGVLASMSSTSGVHVCGDGDRRLALEAGPHVVGFDIEHDLSADGDALSRFLEGDGWIAWGVVPTDRPLGSSPEPLWRALVDVWCDLTRRGCDPIRLRTQSLITPGCGLASHSLDQAQQLIELTNEIAERVHSQAVAARLTLGA